MDAKLVLLGIGPELHLSEDLVGETVAHDEARVTGGTAEVDQTALSKHNQVATILELVTVNLQTRKTDKDDNMKNKQKNFFKILRLHSNYN